MAKFLDVTMEERQEVVEEQEFKKPPYDWRFENSISYGPKIEVDGEYSQWRTNSTVANYEGCLFHVNEMNINYDLTDEMHYTYLFASIRKYKRKGKRKTDQEKKQEAEQKKQDSLVSLVSDYYKYNKLRAKEALKLLTPEHIDYIKQKQEKGGVK